MESIKKKGDSYVSQIPVKRFLATLFKFDCAVVLYYILGLILSREMSAKNILLSFIGWESLGNSNWYIFIIFVLYILTYIAFKFLGTKKPIFPAAVIAGLIVILIFIASRYNIKPLYWYDTALCFALGIFYSLYKEKVASVVNHNIVTWVITVVLAFSLYLTLRKMGTAAYLLANLCFAFGVLTATMRITFNNKVLKWCGDNLFEIYILQRIPMISLKALGLADFNIIVYFILCAVITVLLTICFKPITGKAWNGILSFQGRGKK